MRSFAKGLTRKYYKTVDVPAEYTAWTQPVLSANGTMGGTTFAVAANVQTNVSGVRYAWYAFDNNASSYWRGNSTGWISFYNPVPLKVASIQWVYFYSYPKGGTVEGSNDNSQWVKLCDWTNSAAANFTITVNSTTEYKYHRVNITGVNKDVIHCVKLNITASYKTREAYSYETESTADDYDRYEDVPGYYATVIGDVPGYYLAFLGSEARYLKQWVQPELTSNTSYGTLLATSQFDSAGTHDAWHAFSTSQHQWISSPTSGLAQETLVWQLPDNERIYVNSVELDGADVSLQFPTKVDVFGSNDAGQTFTIIGSATTEAGYESASPYTLIVNCANTTAFNMIGFALSKSASSDNLTAIADIRIDAYTDGSPDDYDVVMPPAYL